MEALCIPLPYTLPSCGPCHQPHPSSTRKPQPPYTHAHTHAIARFRLLRLGHSIMGGVFLAPAQIAGHSVYSAFHLQLAGAAIVPGGRRSLHIGLGAGTAVRGMQRAGVVAGG